MDDAGTGYVTSDNPGPTTPYSKPCIEGLQEKSAANLQTCSWINVLGPLIVKSLVKIAGPFYFTGFNRLKPDVEQIYNIISSITSVLSVNTVENSSRFKQLAILLNGSPQLTNILIAFEILNRYNVKITNTQNKNLDAPPEDAELKTELELILKLRDVMAEQRTLEHSSTE